MDFKGFDFDIEFQRWSCPNALKRAAPKEAVVVVDGKGKSRDGRVVEVE